ncbi:MAG: YidC/Oxa1 family membrane protein insertase [Candidatus Berkelbacteria bacterium]|nr:YidC/Oxa1 family membrane protein insertase [Candidatus Berkelbacteria bacterium]
MKNLLHIVLYKPLYNVLIFITGLVPGHSILWSILILTLIIRLALLPQSLKAAFFQIKNFAIQTKINKIRKTITDPKKQQEAIMAVYKEEGHSPFGSCLPTLIQIPIILVLYSVFRSGLSGKGYADLYSFVHQPSFINTAAMGLDLTKPSLWVLPIIAGLFQLGYSMMSMPKPSKNPEEADPMAMASRQMIFMMPVITMIVCRLTPAALVVYWIVTNFFFIGQQWYVNYVSKKVDKGNLDPWQKIQLGFSLPKVAEVDKAEIEQMTEDKSKKEPEAKEVKKESNLQDRMIGMMDKRLSKAERKSGVNVTVRTKK